MQQGAVAVSEPATAARSGVWTAVAYALPPALLLLLLGIYWVSPSFYLDHVLQYKGRESQAVEIATVAMGLVASAILFYCAARQWKWQRSRPGASRLPGGAFFLALIALASLFFAGEEMSWGQTYLGWKTPEGYAKVSGETNLHNAKLPISVQGLGTLFIAGMFILLPAAWSLHRRGKVRLPADWEPAIAEGPVGACMAWGIAWKWFKDVYRMGKSEAELQGSRFYVDFLEQINEQKELLVAMGLLMYALYRLADLRRLPRGSVPVAGPSVG